MMDKDKDKDDVFPTGPSGGTQEPVWLRTHVSEQASTYASVGVAVRVPHSDAPGIDGASRSATAASRWESVLRHRAPLSEPG